LNNRIKKLQQESKHETKKPENRAAQILAVGTRLQCSSSGSQRMQNTYAGRATTCGRRATSGRRAIIAGDWADSSG
jgi:hypothetical protein